MRAEAQLCSSFFRFHLRWPVFSSFAATFAVQSNERLRKIKWNLLRQQWNRARDWIVENKAVSLSLFFSLILFECQISAMRPSEAFCPSWSNLVLVLVVIIVELVIIKVSATTSTWHPNQWCETSLISRYRSRWLASLSNFSFVWANPAELRRKPHRECLPATCQRISSSFKRLWKKCRPSLTDEQAALQIVSAVVVVAGAL